MAEISWIKLKTDMFDSTKIRLIEKLPEGDTILVIWIKLLTAAGKANCNGYIMLTENIAMNVEEMAVIFDRPLNTVRLALEAFKRYGMIDVEENEIIRIANWEKHQNIDGMEKIREQNRIRKQKQREQKKALEAPKNEGVSRDSHGTVTQSHATDKELDKDKDKELDIEIDKEKELQQEESAPPSSPVVAVVNPFAFYAQNGFGLTMNDITREKIVAWCEDLSDELVVHAMQIAMERNRVSWSYAEGILKKWHAKGIKTLADVDALVAQFEAEQASKGQHIPFQNKRTENVPEWFGEHKQETIQSVPASNTIDFEAERKRVLAKLGGD